jgi:hypothetical protein
MTKTSVKLGDIVTVVSDASSYEGRQGKVVRVIPRGEEDGPIGVKFHKSYMFHYVRSQLECVVHHEEHELRVDKAWSCASRAVQLFPRTHHSVYELLFDFDPQNPCMRDGCDRFATKRCTINIWGCVSQLDLCTKHGEIDGMCGEMLPDLKKDYVPATPIRKKEAA